MQWLGWVKDAGGWYDVVQAFAEGGDVRIVCVFCREGGGAPAGSVKCGDGIVLGLGEMVRFPNDRPVRGDIGLGSEIG
jgi:hypothetical protein